MRRTNRFGGNGHGAGRELNIALAGLGYWGPNLLRVLSGLPAVNVAWICDRDAEQLARHSRLYPGARATRRFDDLLEDPAVDAVVIATPVFTHFDLASRSLWARKHTFVEKPLAASASEADKLLDLAAAEDLVLMCGHTFLFSPPVRAVKALLESGDLGEIYFATSSRVNLGLHQSDVSVIWDLGPHDFSIIRYLLDEEPEYVSAVGRDSIVEGIADVAFVTLRYPSGMLVNIELSWLAPSKLRRTVLVGTRKMVVYEDGAAEPVRVFDRGVEFEDPTSFGEHQLSYRTGDILSPRIDTAEPLALQMSAFADGVRAGAAPPGHTELASEVVRMIEAAEESLGADGEPVRIRAEARRASSQV